MNKANGNMTISDLSKRSNIPASTIKFYLRKKLLPRPIKTGATRAYYTLKHLDRLRLIKKIQKEGNIPLEKIREITHMIDAEDKSESRNYAQGMPSIRSEIIQSAITLFRKKGYETVTITEIVAAAQIGCSSFYKWFSNKKELFIACIHEIISSENISTDVEEISEEKDILQFFANASKIYRQTSPVFRDMMEQLHAAAINDPAEFADKMDEVIEFKIQTFEDRIKRGMDKGVIRNLNKTVLAVMVYGIEEATYQYSSHRKLDESQRDALGETIMDILLHGIIKHGHSV
jgi:AcrR family transcriptional regulator